MRKQIIFISIILGIVAFFSRAPFLEQYQSHWDGPQYSIAVVRYSFLQQTPAPPGYPFYIALGRFFHFFVTDPHMAILAVSVLGSMLGAIAIFLVGTYIYNTRIGIAASLIFLSGSTFYYFGLTPYPYGLLPFVTILVAYATYLSFMKQLPVGIFLGIATGILIGIRPQEILLCGPLCFLGFLYLNNKEKLLMLLTSIGIFLLWFIPLTHAVGGIETFFAISNQFSKGALRPSIATGMVNDAIMIKGFLLSFGFSAAFLLVFIKDIATLRYRSQETKRMIFFYLCWIIPGFLFNLFIRSDHAGYQMGYLTALLLLIAYALWRITRKNNRLYIILLSAVVLFNLAWFFYNRDPHFTKPYRPTSFHYTDIRKNDIKMNGKVTFIENKFNPHSTMIITTDTLWRPYMYYFKQYHLVDLSGLDIPDIGYKYSRFDAFQWNMQQTQNYSLTVIIPKDITTIVLTDDAAFQWIKNYPHTNIHLPGNSTITVLTVMFPQQIRYNYHSISIR